MEPEAADLRRPIGMLFVERGLVSDEDLQSALEHQRQTGGKLGEILVERGLISRLDLASVISEQWEADGRVARLAPVAAPQTTSAPADVTTIGPLADLRAAVDELREQITGAVSAPQELDGEIAARLDRLEQELHSTVEAMTARISGPLGTQGIFQAVEALREQVEARDADGSLPGVLDDLRADLDRAVGGLRERIDVLAADRPVGVAAEPDLEVRAQLEGLAVAVARVEERDRDARPDASLVEALERLQADVEALTARPADAGPATEAVIEALAALPAQLESQPDHELRAAVASLGERIDALSGLSTPPATDDGLRDELTALREAVSALAGHANDASDLRAELDALAAVPAALADEMRELRKAVARVAEQPPPEDLRAELAALAARLSGPRGTQGVLQAIEELPGRIAGSDLVTDVTELRKMLIALPGRIAVPDHSTELRELRDEVARIAQRDPVAELRAELEGLATRLAGPLGLQGILQAVEGLKPETSYDRDHELRERVMALADRLDGLSVGFDSELRGAVEEVRDTISSLAERVAALADLPRDGVGDELAAAVASVQRSLDGIAERDARLAGELEAIATRISGPLGTQELLDAVHALLEQPSGVRADELHDVVGELRGWLDERIAAATPAIEPDHELRAAVHDVHERQDALASELRASLAELAASSRGVEPEQIETLRSALTELADNLAADSRAHDEDDEHREELVLHELRDGLARLEERLGGGLRAELDAEHEAGVAALRDTIGRLEEQLDGAANAVLELATQAQPQPETAFVALVPVAEGYAFVEREGAPPPVGAELFLPEHESTFTVVKLARSPLPGDRRRCAYLEPGA